MKTHISTLFAATLCMGCSNSSDSAKIDALSKKIDQLERNQALAITNEFVLYSEIQTLKAEATNLPAANQVDAIQNGIERLAGADEITSQILANLTSIEATNLLQINLLLNVGSASDSKLLQDIDGTAAEILNGITNGLIPDVTYTRLRIDQINGDVRNIK